MWEGREGGCCQVEFKMSSIMEWTNPVAAILVNQPIKGAPPVSALTQLREGQRDLSVYKDMGSQINLGSEHAYSLFHIFVYLELTLEFFLWMSSRGGHIRPIPVFKPPGSLTANHDAELYAPYRTPPRAASSTTNSSSCNSSPTSRYQTLYSVTATSWPCLTPPRFSIGFFTNPAFSAWGRSLSIFETGRFWIVAQGNVQHNDEWVGGWIRLRLLSFPLLQLAGIISVMIWLWPGLMGDWIKKVWIWYQESDHTGCSQLVTGLESMHLGLEERRGS